MNNELFIAIDNSEEFQKLKTVFELLDFEYQSPICETDKFFLIDLDERLVKVVSTSQFIDNFRELMYKKIEFKEIDELEQQLLNEMKSHLKDGYYIVIGGSINRIENFCECEKTNTVYTNDVIFIGGEAPLYLKVKNNSFIFKVLDGNIHFTNCSLFRDIIKERYVLVNIIKSEVDKTTRYDFPQTIPFSEQKEA